MEVEGMLLFSIMDGIGYQKQQILLNRFPDFAALMNADEKRLRDISALSEKDVACILHHQRHPELLTDFRHKMKKEGIGYISREEKEYPARLKVLPDPPCGIFYKGRLPCPKTKQIAMVGARMCSPYGKKYAAEIAKALVGAGASVISGMARGVDGISQEAALDAGGETFGILAGGVDQIYPPEHRALYQRICENGGIISEYPPGIAPARGMFPRRNRIISALADALIIIEARAKSGSLITGDFALEQGKDIFVLPGRLGDPLSVGCNAYIKQGAGIITSIEELLLELGLSSGKINEEKMKNNFALEKEDSLVYSCLRLVPKTLEELLEETKLPLLAVIESAQRLTDFGLAEEVYKNQYSRSR